MPTFYQDSNGSDLYDTLIPKILYGEGTLWNWGDDSVGQLGQNLPFPTQRSSPVQTVARGTNWRQVSCGGSTTSAIKTDGTLWMWGSNGYGNLGTFDTTSRSSPVQTVAGGTNWKQVSCGSYHTGCVKTDGTLWMWGNNSNGQLGDYTTAHRSSPVQTVAGGTTWKQVSCGLYHTGCVKTDGTLWMWGYNSYGGLGDSSLTNRSSPVQTVAGGTNWKQVSCGSFFSGAIKTDGTLWLWGDNVDGQLGIGNVSLPGSSPIQTIAGGTNWKQLSCGNGFVGCIKTDGTLWMWGFAGQGRLGTNDLNHRSSPIQTIAGGTNWKQVSCGSYHTGCVKTDGTLWMWGYNGDTFQGGQLGTNNIIHRSSPVQTIAGGTNWKQVACGQNHTGAVKDDGII